MDKMHYAFTPLHYRRRIGYTPYWLLIIWAAIIGVWIVITEWIDWERR